MTTSLNDEGRKAVLDAVDALRQWSNEIVAVNDRCSTKAIDRIAAAQQAMGWPDHKTAKTGYAAVPPGKMHYFLLVPAARDILLKACNLQTDVIDKVAEACFASELPKRGMTAVAAAGPVFPAAEPVAPYPSARWARIVRMILGIFVAALLVGSIWRYATHRGPELALQPARPPIVTPSPENVEYPPASAPTATEEAAAPPPAAEESKPDPGMAAPVGLVAVQLGAAASEAKATAKWRQLQKQLPELLASREPVIQKVKHNGRASWQLRTGGFADRAQASAFCKKIHASGVACKVLEAD